MDFKYDFWKLDSELYQHVRASTGPEGTADEPHTSVQPPTALSYVCLWDHGPCGFTAATIETVLKHISAHHLRGRYPQPDDRVQCRCIGCPLRKSIRRDTILRHIRKVHYADKCRQLH